VNDTPKKVKKDFPKTITVDGISGITAKIYKQVRNDKGGEYTSYLLYYSLLGKSKMQSFADLELAKAAGEEAIKRIANNEQRALELKNGDRDVYLRAQEYLAPHNIALDVCARDHVEILTMLRGMAQPVEAIRDWVRRNSTITARATVPEAVSKMLKGQEAQQNGKRKAAWVKLLRSHLENKFAENFSCDVREVQPSQINAWLIGLPCAERTKKNIKDALGYFFKFCKREGYISKDEDPLSNVENFSKRPRGKIHILTPEELRGLFAKAKDLPPRRGWEKIDMTAYIALRAFAGLRDSEASAIEWQHIDLNEGWITITEEVAKQTDSAAGLRRLIPVRPCLKQWLKPYVKESGRVFPYDASSKQVSALCKLARVTWKRNCLRHACVSMAVAESGDFANVALQSGNSVAVIKQHYYQVAKPAVAAEWFGITPKSVAAWAKGKAI
jgi:integrase